MIRRITSRLLLPDSCPCCIGRICHMPPARFWPMKGDTGQGFAKQTSGPEKCPGPEVVLRSLLMPSSWLPRLGRVPAAPTACQVLPLHSSTQGWGWPRGSMEGQEEEEAGGMGRGPERTPWGRTIDTQACCRWVQGNKLTAPRAHVGGVRDTVVATQAGFLPSQNLGTSIETGKQTRGCWV